MISREYNTGLMKDQHPARTTGGCSNRWTSRFGRWSQSCSRSLSAPGTEPGQRSERRAELGRGRDCAREEEEADRQSHEQWGEADVMSETRLHNAAHPDVLFYLLLHPGSRRVDKSEKET